VNEHEQVIRFEVTKLLVQAAGLERSAHDIITDMLSISKAIISGESPTPSKD
jgi:hypothetical protein